MPLFVLPQQMPLNSSGRSMPLAKLHFYQTGTSTPQNTYTTAALSVAHPNPVVADSNGIFPPIYFDPSLGAYRVTLTDSSDVTQSGYPIDGVPSHDDVAQNFTITDTAPKVLLLESDASVDNKVWRFLASSEVLSIDAGNDAQSVFHPALSVTRTGSTIVSTTLGGRAQRTSAQPAFAAHRTSSQTLTNNATTTIICDAEEFDQATVYNNSTGTFTAPAAGLYFLQAVLRIVSNASSGQTEGTYFLSKNDASFGTAGSAWVLGGAFGGATTGTDVPANSIGHYTGSIVASLAANDTIKVKATQPNNGGGAFTLSGSLVASFFSGYLLG